MSLKIKETSNYNLFEKYPSNREIRRNKKLEKSMTKYGWIDGFPALVEETEDGELRIVDGHHRFKIAKLLGIPVKYVMTAKKINLHEIAGTTLAWAPKDYLAYYCKQGLMPYLVLRRYMRETGIGIQNAMCLLAGVTSHGMSIDLFRSGAYTIPEDGCELSHNVGDIVMYLQESGVRFAAHNTFVSALTRCCLTPQFDASQFKRRAKSNLSLFQKQPTVDRYMDVIDEVYNRQSKNKIPLKFLVEEAMKARVPSGLWKGGKPIGTATNKLGLVTAQA